MDKIKKPDYNKMPKQVRVLGKIFKIRSMKEDEHPDADGTMTLDLQLIGVREKEALAYMQDTLLHETIHAIDETLFLKMTERQVNNLASVLLGVLKDNPEFTSWILQNEE
jgi:hypothetical protein